MSALQISFLIPLAPSLPPSLWPHADLSSCSSTSPHLSSECQAQSYQQPRTLLPVCSFSFSRSCMNTCSSPHPPCSPSDHAPCCAELTPSNAADGWAAHAWPQSKQLQPLKHTGMKSKSSSTESQPKFVFIGMNRVRQDTTSTHF